MSPAYPPAGCLQLCHKLVFHLHELRRVHRDALLVGTALPESGTNLYVIADVLPVLYLRTLGSSQQAIDIIPAVTQRSTPIGYGVQAAADSRHLTHNGKLRKACRCHLEHSKRVLFLISSC